MLFLQRLHRNDKKYFYVLRPLLACLWIEREFGTVPTEFEKLVSAIITDSNLKKIIQKLIEDKKEGKELSYGVRIPEISNFIDEKIQYFNQKKFNFKRIHPDTEILNKLFRNSIEEIWGNKY